MMIDDDALIRTLTLLRTSPSFAYRQQSDASLAVVNPKLIKDDGAVYWVAGRSNLRGGTDVPSVFVIENGGKNLLSVYWYIRDHWYGSDDPSAVDALGLSKEEVFPFDWSYAIPVAYDPFHD